MKKFVIEEVTPKQFEELSKLTDCRFYKEESILIYEGHTPFVGYVLVDGKVEILKKNKIVSTISPLTLFAVNELINHAPVNFTVRVSPESKVLIMDKSTIHEIQKICSQKEIKELDFINAY